MTIEDFAFVSHVVGCSACGKEHTVQVYSISEEQVNISAAMREQYEKGFKYWARCPELGTMLFVRDENDSPLKSDS